MARMQILFDGFKDLAAQIDKAQGDLHGAVNEALEETERIVHDNLETAAAPYARGGRKGYATGAMYAARKGLKGVQWAGTWAEIGVGFDLKANGGFHSIFVMYGTPRMAKDAKVYNAIRGAKTRKQIAEKQQGIMKKHLELGG